MCPYSNDIVIPYITCSSCILLAISHCMHTDSSVLVNSIYLHTSLICKEVMSLALDLRLPVNEKVLLTAALNWLNELTVLERRI